MERSLEQVAALMHVNAATLYRWLKRADITPRQDATDRRRKYLTDEQVKQLRKMHKRTISHKQKRSPDTMQNSLHGMQQDLSKLHDTVDTLQLRLDALEKHDNT